MRQAFAYIANDSPQNAKAVIERIEQSINTLCVHPYLGRLGRVEGTQEFVIVRTPFIVVYRPHKTTLWILSVLHTSKKYPFIL
jgi:plasmid stabilization system protein ParE